jgi:hypothetical protein
MSSLAMENAKLVEGPAKNQNELVRAGAEPIGVPKIFPLDFEK